MFESVRQLAHLASKSNKVWLLPIILALIIVALLVVSANLAPIPIFLYPLI
jgi:hypothetical protein